jgi:predicted nucleic acid-binding protein
MALNYKVQAQVVNIKIDTPKKEDKFLLDTNVLYWNFSTLAHSRSLPTHLKPKIYQITKYPKYLEKIQYAGSSLFYCGLSMAEIAHLIEKHQKETNFPTLPPKEYRHNYPMQRYLVITEIQNCWSEIEAVADSTDILIDKITTKDALANFENIIVDGYDSFIIESMFKAGINQIITDDGDYITVPGITVFTANDKAIDAAKYQGKLLNR